jgi:hypothetical protein
MQFIARVTAGCLVGVVLLLPACSSPGESTTTGSGASSGTGGLASTATGMNTGGSGATGTTGSTGSGGAPPTGALVDGQTVRLSGTGFGSKSPAGPVLFDRFEKGALGAQIVKPEIGPDWVVDTGAIRYDQTRAFSGSQSGMIDWTDATTYDNLVYIGNLNATEIYYSYRMYKEVNGGSDPDAWNFKHGAITSADIDVYHGTLQYTSVELGSGQTKDSYTITGLGAAGVAANAFYSNDDTAYFQNDGWHRLEHYVKLSTPAGAANGKRYFKVDGDGNFTYSGAPGGHYASPSGAIPFTAYDGDALVTREVGDDALALEHVLLPFYLRGGYSARAWVDEVYIDRTQARVEFGDHHDWQSCTKRFPQPALTWTDTTIQVKANQGTFTVGETVYGFVVVADGTILPLGALGSWGS